jgi:hypothetical protein
MCSAEPGQRDYVSAPPAGTGGRIYGACRSARRMAPDRGQVVDGVTGLATQLDRQCLAATVVAQFVSRVVWSQDVWGWSALRTGLALAPGPLMVPLMSFLVTGRMIKRAGPGVTIGVDATVFASARSGGRWPRGSCLTISVPCSAGLC